MVDSGELSRVISRRVALRTFEMSPWDGQLSEKCCSRSFSKVDVLFHSQSR